MADAKRYYWLKLREDFFSSKRIKKLRKIAGGDTYTIIYLKMQLLAMKNGGILEFTGLEQSFAEELALDLDEEPDNVTVTVQYLLSCGLLETSNNKEFFVPYAVENTGSEGAAAKRVRELRARKALQCNAAVTPALRDRYGEIEIEKELELEKELEIEALSEDTEESKVSFSSRSNPATATNARASNSLSEIAQCFEENIGCIAPAEFDLLKSWALAYSPDLVVAVIKDACIRKKKSARYIDRVLIRCIQNGVQNAVDYQTRLDAWEEQNAATAQARPLRESKQEQAARESRERDEQYRRVYATMMQQRGEEQ